MLMLENREFECALEMEIRREGRILANAETVLKNAPKGSLVVKKRKNHNSYYHVVSHKIGDKLFKRKLISATIGDRYGI